MGQRESDSWGDCNLELRSFQGAKTGYDLNLDIIDDPAGECRLLLNVRSDLYTESGAELLIASYEKLIIAFAADPGITLMQPTLYPQREILRALEFSQGCLSFIAFQQSSCSLCFRSFARLQVARDGHSQD